MLRYVFLPMLFPSARCPDRHCRYLIPLKQKWQIGIQYQHPTVAHALAVHSDEGKEIGKFECPQCPKRGTKTTILLQKGTDSKLTKGTVLGPSLTVSPDETQPHRYFTWLVGMFRRDERSMPLLLGFDRQCVFSRPWKLLRRLLHLPIRHAVSAKESAYGRHIWIPGVSGMGKSTLIIWLLRSIFLSGGGATVIDPAGDLADDVLKQVPKNRIKDVLYIKIADRKCPFRLNLLESHDEDEALNLTDELLGTLQRISLNWGDNIALQIGLAIDTVREIGGSLKDVYDLFTIESARDRIVANVQDPELRSFWEGFSSRSYRERAPVINKLRRIVKHPRLAPILCAKECNFDPDTVIADRKIVIVDLSTGSTSSQVNIIAGTFIVTKLVNAAYRQRNKKKHERIRHVLFVDEAQNYMHRGTSFDKLLSEARKYKLTLVLAHQYVKQLTEAVQDAIFQAGVLVCFGLIHKDAKLVKNEFEGISEEMLQRLDVGECICRVHRTTWHLKTPDPKEFPAPEGGDDPTTEIVVRMHEMNAEDPEDHDEEGTQPVEKRPRVAVCEGVT